MSAPFPHSGFLDTGASFVQDRPSVPIRKRNFVVFQGTLGNEQNIGVAVGKMEIKEIKLTPEQPTVNAGDELALTAEIYDTDGKRVYPSGDNIEWEITEGSQLVSKVDNKGLKVTITAGPASGQTRIKAKLKNIDVSTLKEATTQIQILGVDHLQIAPPTPVVLKGKTTRLLP